MDPMYLESNLLISILRGKKKWKDFMPHRMVVKLNDGFSGEGNAALSIIDLLSSSITAEHQVPLSLSSLSLSLSLYQEPMAQPRLLTDHTSLSLYICAINLSSNVS